MTARCICRMSRPLLSRYIRNDGCGIFRRARRLRPWQSEWAGSFSPRSSSRLVLRSECRWSRLRRRPSTRRWCARVRSSRRWVIAPPATPRRGASPTPAGGRLKRPSARSTAPTSPPTRPASAAGPRPRSGARCARAWTAKAGICIPLSPTSTTRSSPTRTSARCTPTS